jgi:hypothetical protein
LDEWSTYTPDGRLLVVSRDGPAWVARCGEGPSTRSEHLDVALIAAIRRDADVVAQSMHLDYAEWVRGVADSLARSSD